MEALLNLGFIESTLCVLSYFWSRVYPVKNPTNFRDWVSNQFGKRLFNIFFKTYTEKVWGMKCEEISADWAAQRIKGLSLGSAILNAILPKKKVQNKSQVIKTLIDSFRYPRKGPGMMWERTAEYFKNQGGVLRMGVRLQQLKKAADGWQLHGTVVESVEGSFKSSITTINASSSATLSAGTEIFSADHIISTAPIRELMRSLSPAPKSLQHSNSLKYRDFLTVSLILKDREIFSDNWIYIHDPSVKVGRIQNFKSWSPEMVPDADKSCYGLEYFCFEGDNLWNSSDSDLVKLASRELVELGLASADDILDGCVVRQPKAYPVYDDEYSMHVQKIRDDIDANYAGLHLIGRNGMHKYNNQDHAMMTAMLCVQNILTNKKVYDVWNVNQDAEYHEAGETGSQKQIQKIEERLVPRAVEVKNDLQT